MSDEGSFEDHLEKLERVFSRLLKAGLKVNAYKSFFARRELEYLGYWITRDGIQPLPKKVEAIMKIDAPPLAETALGVAAVQSANSVKNGLHLVDTATKAALLSALENDLNGTGSGEQEEADEQVPPSSSD